MLLAADHEEIVDDVDGKILLAHAGTFEVDLDDVVAHAQLGGEYTPAAAGAHHVLLGARGVGVVHRVEAGQGIAGARGPVVVGLDGANPTLKASCQSAGGIAAPPVRLAAFVDAFGSAGKLTNICNGDYQSALDTLGALVTKQTSASWCLPYDPVDTAPLTKGLQADCTVVASQAGPLPACTQGQTSACYRLEHGPACGKSSTRIHIENAEPAAIGKEVFAICLAP